MHICGRSIKKKIERERNTFIDKDIYIYIYRICRYKDKRLIYLISDLAYLFLVCVLVGAEFESERDDVGRVHRVLRGVGHSSTATSSLPEIDNM